MSISVTSPNYTDHATRANLRAHAHADAMYAREYIAAHIMAGLVANRGALASERDAVTLTDLLLLELSRTEFKR